MLQNLTSAQLRAALDASTFSSANQTVSLHGCVHKIRQMRGFAFVLVRTAREIIQCVWADDQAGFPLSAIPEGACAAFTGVLMADERSRTGFEIRLQTARVLSLPAEPLPIVINGRECNLSLDTTLDTRPISLRHAEQRAIFRIQACLAQGFREALALRDFVEIHTPKIVSAGAEGGANVFPIAYFGKPAYLAQSPQFYKQMMAGVFERVFETGPVFRAEKHDTARHLNEYTSLDLEMAYIEDFTDIMTLENDVLRHMMALLAVACAPELNLLGCHAPTVGDIPAVRFRDAKVLAAKGGTADEDDDLSPEEDARIGAHFQRETGSDFVFVTHYPSSKRPFYAMDDPDDASVTLSFDLLYRGVEITTGGQRIHDYHEQLAKVIRRGMDAEAFASYLMMHKHGMPPHGGLGMGLERLTTRLLGLDNIRLATLFPRDTQRLTP